MVEFGELLIKIYFFVFAFLGGAAAGYLLVSRNLIVSLAGIIVAVILSIVLNFLRLHPSDYVPGVVWLMATACVAFVIALVVAWYRPVNVPRDF